MESSRHASPGELLTAPIALCCNGTMLPGLHATLASLVKHLGRREIVSLTLYIQDITAAEAAALSGTVRAAGGVGALTIHEADLADFKSLKALQGDWMTYLRLCLPRLMPEARQILYLDSDLVVNTDACAFFDHELGEFPLGAIEAQTVEWSLDRDFLKTVGLAENDLCFNAGVLLFNAELWRSAGLVEKSLEMARTYSSILTSHDQSVLNGLFSRNFYRLPKNFNIVVAPQDQAFAEADGIYHFVGSPKPWDPWGRFVHGNWPMWDSVIRGTDFSWRDFLSRHIGAYVVRAWTLRRSYIRTWLRKK